VTPEAVAGFRRFFRPRDVVSHDQPEAVFSALVDIARWAERQRGRPDPANDAALSAGTQLGALHMALLLHLATIDRAFFDLARRMAARTLVRHSPPARLYLEMAAALLVAGDGPRGRKPVLARDAAVILAVAAGTDAGWTPTESFDPDRPPRSGCGKVAAAMRWEYSRAEAIWKAREERLHDAGFAPNQVSEFLGMISPMIGGTN
jgi:hypothetical protein